MTRKIAIIPMVRIIRRESLSKYHWIPFTTYSFNRSQFDIDKIILPIDAVACEFYYNYVDVETKKFVAKDCFPKRYFIGKKEDLYCLNYTKGNFHVEIANKKYLLYPYRKPALTRSTIITDIVNLSECKQFDTPISDVTYGMRMNNFGYYTFSSISGESINGLKTNPVLNIDQFDFPSSIFRFFVFREDHFSLQLPKELRKKQDVKAPIGKLAKKITPNIIVGTRVTAKNVDSIFGDNDHESIKEEIKSGTSYWYQTLVGHCARKNDADVLLEKDFLTIAGKKPKKSRNFEYLLKDEKTPKTTPECDLGK